MTTETGMAWPFWSDEEWRRVVPEMEARGALLGMTYYVVFHAFVVHGKSRKRTEFYDPDTMELMSVEAISRRDNQWRKLNGDNISGGMALLSNREMFAREARGIKSQSYPPRT